MSTTPAMSRTELLSLMPYAVALGVVLDEATPSLTRGSLPWAPGRCTVDSAMHGGALMSLADSAAAVCAFLNLPEGSTGTTTVESKTNFMRAVREGSVTASSTPLHAGRRFVVVETELRDDAGRLVAKVTQTQAVL